MVSFPPSPNPLALTSIDMDTNPHREIQNEHWDLAVIEEDPTHNSPQTPEVALDLQPTG
jgi:hypothetical protein